jgi:hypothetical protein
MGGNPNGIGRWRSNAPGTIHNADKKPGPPSSDQIGVSPQAYLPSNFYFHDLLSQIDFLSHVPDVTD